MIVTVYGFMIVDWIPIIIYMYVCMYVCVCIYCIAHKYLN